ncbi:DEAD/DEAH box helicase [Paenibacillus contaminans]|uniref:DNA/RNA helicase n=1 Tax=Paenibacillus contaminans TaxID=450362 RepID=A0A329MBL7_9BACL|nr:helicase-related protein [Paenibacillus contaminans]RAV17391.1 DNA/RNA helicase [Paenibacillus contaminans]
MKATLYAVKSGGEWSWRATPDFRIDLAYWLRQYDGPRDIVSLEPALSWGQAVWIRDTLNLRRLQPSQHQHVRRELTKRLRESGDGSQLLRNVKFKERPLSGESVHDFSGTDRSTAEKIAKLLQGRSLLPEELHSLLTAHGLGHVVDSWLPYVQLAALEGHVTLTNAVRCRENGWFWRRVRSYSCRRCGSGDKRMYWSRCLFCGTDCPYCEECLTMGRSRFCTLLILGEGSVTGEERDSVVSATGGRLLEERHMVRHARSYQAGAALGAKGAAAAQEMDGLAAHLRPWGLSPAQTEASGKALLFLKETAAGMKSNEDVRAKKGSASSHGRQALSGNASIHPNANVKEDRPSFLIWAVTGAGKTEMIYPLVSHELAAGRNVLIATPRRDVVLELMPRLAKAFPGEKIVTLYGGSKQRWEQGSVTLSTTHQLMRFWRRFDLVVIDELDAFPFHGNPVLEFAAIKACKEDGRYILLSATPPTALQEASSSGKLPHVKVPVRYHRHPLPGPVLLTSKPLRSWIKLNAVPKGVLLAMKASVARGAQLFIFVPAIVLVEPLVALLRRTFPELNVQGTSSKDEDRAEKVIGFREKRTDMLVTTTILERGVTVPKTDVFILGADSGLFNEAALVQMAGRAGRSKDDPFGYVYFIAYERTQAQRAAIRQIERMNRLAKEKGYLLDEGPQQQKHASQDSGEVQR